ncbi:cytidine/deoxycytidylate deaminase family protein [Patescibacteria group bacterium]
MRKERLGWDEMWLEVAKVFGKRSTCMKNELGSIFIRDNRLLSYGYNGAPIGSDHCIDYGRCNKDFFKTEWCVGAYSEMNATLDALKNKEDLVGSTAYCSMSPCMHSAKHLINLEINRLVYGELYKKSNGEGEAAIELLRESGITVDVIDESLNKREDVCQRQEKQ